MKKVLLIIASLVVSYLALMMLDVLTEPATTASQIEQSELYLIEQNLPTPPKIFYHDGCTLFPDYILGHDFSESCLKHDIAYWAGGTKAMRMAADLEFKETVSHTGLLGPILFAPIMHIAVHYFGDSFLSKALGANWGYGWNK